MPHFSLPPLPYRHNDLEPFFSAETLEYHYNKHHQTYVDQLNKLLAAEENASMRELPLEAIIQRSQGPLFNNAAQTWNHAFYWHCLHKAQPGKQENLPNKHVLGLIKTHFGGLENFKTQFAQSALSNFGSGWTWLVWNHRDEKLTILNTSNAGNHLVTRNNPLSSVRDDFVKISAPLSSVGDHLADPSRSHLEADTVNQLVPLLTCDVWEHAYYIDYRNARAKYIEAFWQVVNWDFVEKNLVSPYQFPTDVL